MSLLITGQHVEAIDFASPLIAVDHVVSDQASEVLATKKIVAVDPYLEGHYPDFTIYPGVFTIETVYQAAVAAIGSPQTPLEIRAVDSVRFQAPLLPGDVLTATLQLKPVEGSDTTRVVAKCHRDDDTTCAEVRLTIGPRDLSAPSGVLSHARLKSLLPHRNPMLHVDRVDELDPGVRLVASKAVSGSEACYRHIRADAPPEAYRYPTSLIVESMGQAGGALWILSAAADGDATSKKLIFGSARGLEVYGAAYPGDVMRHVVHITSVKGDSAFMTGETWVEDRLIARVDTILALLRAEDTLAP